MKKIKLTLVAGFVSLTIAACTGSNVSCEYPREHYEPWQTYEDCASADKSGATQQRATRTQTFSRSLGK